MFDTVLVSLDLKDERSRKKALPAALSHLSVKDDALHVMTALPDCPTPSMR